MNRKHTIVSLALTGILVAGFMYLRQPDTQNNIEDAAATPDSELQNAAATVTEESRIDDPSPFDVVENIPSEVTNAVLQPETVNTEGEVPQRDETSSATSLANSQESPSAIAAPSSYPIEDAEKYFIPKELRGPGNIGGPPPLNFPGGPNDKSLQSNEG